MICGGIVCFSLVKCMGKRCILLISIMTCSLMCIVLGWYTYMDQLNAIWIPVLAMLILHLGMTFGLYSIPWMLTSEVFPLK